MDILENSELEESELIHSYNIVMRQASRKEAILAEDLLVKMNNRGLVPNEGTMDALILNLTHEKALSMVQSCFNQYGCRPLRGSFLIVLDFLAEVGESCDIVF